jgi:hypothetical protein
MAPFARRGKNRPATAPSSHFCNTFARADGATVTACPASAGKMPPVPKAASPTKADFLAARPIRADGWSIESAGEGKWRLTVPLKPTRLARLLLRVPPQGIRKSFELDEPGKHLWDACDGETAVERLVASMCERFDLAPDKAESAVTTFLRTLASRGLIGMMVVKEPHEP